MGALARMCGIVGILGREAVAASLVDALKRLEYRGYDSAGVATLEGGQLARRRAEGKLRNLEARLASDPLQGTIGIGHTRWATHGEPTESNAHPHATDRLAVVHNGIIENYRELRAELENKGARFGSQTDTEVVAHLVTQEMKNGRPPAEAVAAALPRLRGAFALAFLFLFVILCAIGVSRHERAITKPATVVAVACVFFLQQGYALACVAALLGPFMGRVGGPRGRRRA